MEINEVIQTLRRRSGMLTKQIEILNRLKKDAKDKELVEIEDALYQKEEELKAKNTYLTNYAQIAKEKEEAESKMRAEVTALINEREMVVNKLKNYKPKGKFLQDQRKEVLQGIKDAKGDELGKLLLRAKKILEKAK